jgi:Ca2+-transporting ATPase
VEFSILAGQKDPFDPMEKALRQLGGLKLANTEHLHDDWTLFHEYPLSQELLALSIVWKSPDGENYVIAAKGAPEAVFDLCHIEPSRLNELTKQVESMAGEGLRVLGVAKAEFQKNEVLPDGQHDFRFQFLGLVGFSDPVRPMVAQAVKECYDAGIRVVMITGDYPVTAKKIGKEVGLHCCDHAITGAELDHMSDDELREKISDVNIFARVVPEQKLRLVKAFRARGEVVAMTGDGVNDAPALKAADIGIAMGARGTDVAREASSMVLLDDDFSSIVEAVRMGRRIFDNLKKAMAYIFAVHVPIAGMSLLPVIFHWPLVLFPVHIVFLELIIDPACSTVFESEPEESDVMKRKPRSLTDPLFSRRMISLSVLQGLIVFLIVLAVYSIALIRGSDEKEARTLTFTTLIVANLGLILINRSWTRTFFNLMRSRNNALWYVISGATFFLGLVLYVPWMRDLFDFSYLHISDILICLAAGAASILWFEGLKIISRRRGNV